MKSLLIMSFLVLFQWSWAQEGTEPNGTEDDPPRYGENNMSYYIFTDENGEKYASTAFAGELRGDFVVPAYITDEKIPVKIIGPSWEAPLDELLSFTIPATAEEIKSSVMCGLDSDGLAPKFRGFHVDENNPYFDEREGAVYKKDGTLVAWTPDFDSEKIVIPEGTTGVDQGVASHIRYPKVLVFPSTLEHYDGTLPTPFQKESVVICYAMTPPQLGRTASELEYQGITAYVPQGCVEIYLYHEQWGKCHEIKEITEDITTNIQPRKYTHTIKDTIYSLDGRKINGLQKGLNIVKGTDGRLIKVFNGTIAK